MIEQHFGLCRRPFPSAPDQAFYYPATSHERALTRLLSGLADGEGMVLLTGAPGTGKTLLCQCLYERLGEEVSVVSLPHTLLSDRSDLLQALLYDLSLPHEGRSEQQMRLALIDHLLLRYSEGKKTLLVIDEAQHLKPELLEELRMLGNLEGQGGKAVQVVLIGQPEILTTLADAKLASLRQRIAVRAVIEALEVDEAIDYLNHHLRLAEGKPEQILDAEAIEVLARATGGVPRLLNQAACQAMQLAAEAGNPRVDVEAAMEALSALGLSTESATQDEVEEEEAVIESTVQLPAAAAREAGCRLFLAPSRIA